MAASKRRIVHTTGGSKVPGKIVQTLPDVSIERNRTLHDTTTTTRIRRSILHSMQGRNVRVDYRLRPGEQPERAAKTAVPMTREQLRKKREDAVNRR